MAAGYAKADRGSGKGEKTSGEGGGGEWVAQPIQEPGTFSALGGIYSTVTDLAIWVQGFIDAWPARDGADRHPLCRASRREMQQVHTVMPLMLGAAGESGASRPLSAGYCFGLSSAETLKAGRIIGHSGGYPGFGSNMSWSASAKVGVIGLANGRYGGPYSQVSDTVAKLAQALPAKLSVQPVHAAIAIRAAIDGALNAGRDRGLMELKPLLSANVDQDQPLAVRAKLFDSMVGLHGALTPEPGFAIVGSPTTLGWWLAAANGGRVGVGIMINPEGEVQTLSLTSVRPPTDELKAVLAAAVAAVESGDHEFSGLLLPLQAPPSWTDCDGESTGVALLEGAHIRVAVALEVGAEPVFSPLAEAALPA